MNVSKWRKRLYLIMTVIALGITAQGLFLQVFAADTPKAVEQEQESDHIDRDAVGAGSMLLTSDDYHLEARITPGTEEELLTGQSALIHINISQLKKQLDVPLKLYFQFEEGNSAEEDGTLFGYPLETVQTLDPDSSIKGTFCKTDTPHLYYLKFTNLKAGSDLQMTLSASYKNGASGGGTLLSWMELDGDTTIYSDKVKVCWTVQPDDFPIMESSSSADALAHIGEDEATLANLSYCIKITQNASQAEYGKDYMKQVTFTDVLEVPEGFSWRKGLLEAIENGNCRCDTSSDKKYFYVTIEEDGEQKEYEIAQLDEVSEQNGMCYGPVGLSVKDGKVQLIWIWKNEHSTKQEITIPSFTLTYGSEVLLADTDIAANRTCTFVNRVTAAEEFTYSGIVELEYRDSVNVSIGQTGTHTDIEETEAPYLTGTLVNAEKRLYVTDEAETFRFLICRGNASGLSDLPSEMEKMNWLMERQIPFTITELTVEKGSSGTEAILLDDLKVGTCDTVTGAYQETEEAWEWMKGDTYTIDELSQEGDFTKYIFGNINADQENPYVFTYDPSDSQYLTVTNVRKEWNLQLLSTDSTEDKKLSGAVFGLYTRNQSDQLSQDADLPEQLNLTPEWTKTTQDGTWYLMDLETADENGIVRWSELTENEYYLVEIQAPGGYRLTQAPETIIYRAEKADVKRVNIVSAPLFQMPDTGGIGTTIFKVLGICLIAGGLIHSWVKDRKLK